MSVYHNIRFPDELKEELQKRAAVNHRSFNSEIVFALEWYLEKYDTLNAVLNGVLRNYLPHNTENE